MLNFEKRALVTPGDLLAKGDYEAGENTYKEDEMIYATRIGLFNYENKRVFVVALKAFYIPSPGDLVIGKVVDMGLRGWTVDINCPYSALLRPSDALTQHFHPQKDDLASIFTVGDRLIAKVIAYDRTTDPLLTIREPGLGKITEGRIIKVTPAKIPRIIGKKGSMITLIKKETECQIVVGQNGIILIRGIDPEKVNLAVEAIFKIEEEAHTTGLTDRITEMLKNAGGKKE